MASNQIQTRALTAALIMSFESIFLSATYHSINESHHIVHPDANIR
jgi:hypothetical protein